ncbi:hypothetical protein EIP86_004719 [Pleurotus ostreatoroseus]|nr:hypothetical protein EIP86_004719 [Pleurotus ostreatoroseus]
MPRHRDHWTPPYASGALALRPPRIVNPPLHCIPIHVSSRHGSLGITRNIAWYLCGEPPSRAKFRIGSKLYLKDVNNDPINLILTIVDIVGISRYWVTFRLADVEFEETCKHTIAIPMQFTHLPLLYRLFHLIFSSLLTDDFPDVPFPLPRLVQPRIHGEDQNTHSAGVQLQQSEPRPSGTPVPPGAPTVAPGGIDDVV